MKPLTIEEIKKLPAGEWLYIVDFSDCGNDPRGSYFQIDCKTQCNLLLEGRYHCSRLYSDYGTKWIAYKNKEQTEASSNPCHCKEKEILQSLKTVFNDRAKAYTNWDGNTVKAVTLDWINADIDEIAKDCGVVVD